MRCTPGELARPAGIESVDVPLPRRSFAGRELVVIATRQRLQRDEGGVVAEQDADVGGGLDLHLAGAAHYFPAEAR